ncbi:O-acyltransferase like protein-like [Amphiura filiformis]|uniref:O-acyltransferase like protein-like n=1 Tax=Amphiura filiformis TaxID=82378 RepID=UPI003B21EACE
MCYQNKPLQCTLLLVVLLFAVITIHGQRLPQYSLLSLIKQPKSPEDIRSLAETLASGTLYEYLVTDLFNYETKEKPVDVLAIDMPKNVSNQCQQDFIQMMLDLSQGQMYVLNMLDAAGKLQSGIMDGNFLWTGRYDQCLDVKASLPQRDFNGRYCLTILTASKPTVIPNIDLSVCVPDSCNAAEVDQMMLSGVLGTVLLDILGYNPYTICSIDPEYSTGAIVALCIFSILGLLTVGGTGIGVFRYLRKIILSTDDDEEKDIDDILNQPTSQSADRSTADSIESKTMRDTVKGSVQNKNAVDIPDNTPLLFSNLPKKTIFDLIEQILICFCAITNGKKILTIQKSGPYSHLAALNGIRVLSMFWIILGHTTSLIGGFSGML